MLNNRLREPLDEERKSKAEKEELRLSVFVSDPYNDQMFVSAKKISKVVSKILFVLFKYFLCSNTSF